MRGEGQLEQLCEFVRPRWGLVTNVGESHIEQLLGSRDNIARAKAEQSSVRAAQGVGRGVSERLRRPVGLPSVLHRARTVAQRGRVLRRVGVLRHAGRARGRLAPPSRRVGRRRGAGRTGAGPLRARRPRLRRRLAARRDGRPRRLAAAVHARPARPAQRGERVRGRRRRPGGRHRPRRHRARPRGRAARDRAPGTAACPRGVRRGERRLRREPRLHAGLVGHVLRARGPRRAHRRARRHGRARRLCGRLSRGRRRRRRRQCRSTRSVCVGARRALPTAPSAPAWTPKRSCGRTASPRCWESWRVACSQGMPCS